MFDEIMRFVPYCDQINSTTEAFAGTAVLTLNKPRHELESINDVDGELINFMHQLRDNRESLVNAVKFTPYARDELKTAYEPALHPIERARRFYVRQMQSRNPADQNPNWKRQFSPIDKNGRQMSAQAKRFMNTDHLVEYGERLRGVQIENKNAVEFLKKFDHERALHFIDPPFMPITRENKDGLYRFEMTDEQHHNLLSTIIHLSGFSIVRHYKCEKYDDMLFSFSRFDFPDKRIDGDKTKTESLYISPNLTLLLRSLESKQNAAQLELV